MTKSVVAKYVGSNLVASFTKANPPLVWSFDLDRNHSFTLSVQGDEGGWELGVASFKGEFDVIARFKRQEDAEVAFKEIQKILMKKRRSLFGRVMLILFIGALCVGLLGYGYSSFGRWIMEHELAASSMQAVHAPVEMQDGIPLPADDVLKPPH